MPRIKFTVEGSGAREVEAELGRSVMEATKRHDFALEAACGGAMACATCHVVVSHAWANRVPAPSSDEADVLDVVFGVGPRSRLACQITMTADLDGIEILIPAPLSASL